MSHRGDGPSTLGGVYGECGHGPECPGDGPDCWLARHESERDIDAPMIAARIISEDCDDGEHADCANVMCGCLCHA